MPCLRTAAGAALFLTMTGCAPRDADLTSAQRAALADSVASQMQSYYAAVSAGDADRAIEYYADDPRFMMFSDGTPYAYDALVALTRGAFPMWAHFENTFDSVGVTILSRNAAIVSGPFRQAITDTSDAVLRLRGTVTWIWVRRPDGWRILHGHADHYPDSVP